MKEKILIYDDDAEILLLCKAILQEYDVKTVTSCENIIEDIRQHQPGLILMDLWIPSIGGENAIAIAKQNPVTATIPIIIFSANADIREIATRIKADGYLEKPFSLAIFKQTIKDFLR